MHRSRRRCKLDRLIACEDRRAAASLVDDPVVCRKVARLAVRPRSAHARPAPPVRSRAPRHVPKTEAAMNKMWGGIIEDCPLTRRSTSSVRTVTLGRTEYADARRRCGRLLRAGHQRVAAAASIWREHLARAGFPPAVYRDDERRKRKTRSPLPTGGETRTCAFKATVSGQREGSELRRFRGLTTGSVYSATTRAKQPEDSFSAPAIIDGYIADFYCPAVIRVDGRYKSSKTTPTAI
jgi:hypothetical protein